MRQNLKTSATGHGSLRLLTIDGTILGTVVLWAVLEVVYTVKLRHDAGLQLHRKFTAHEMRDPY